MKHVIKFIQVCLVVAFATIATGVTAEDDNGHPSCFDVLVPNPEGWKKYYDAPKWIIFDTLYNDFYQDPRPGKEGMFYIETYSVQGGVKTLFLKRWDITKDTKNIYQSTQQKAALLLADGTWIFSQQGEKETVITTSVTKEGFVWHVLIFSFDSVEGKKRVVELLYSKVPTDNFPPR